MEALKQAREASGTAKNSRDTEAKTNIVPFDRNYKKARENFAKLTQSLRSKKEITTEAIKQAELERKKMITIETCISSLASEHEMLVRAYQQFLNMKMPLNLLEHLASSIISINKRLIALSDPESNPNLQTAAIIFNDKESYGKASDFFDESSPEHRKPVVITSLKNGQPSYRVLAHGTTDEEGRHMLEMYDKNGQSYSEGTSTAMQKLCWEANVPDNAKVGLISCEAGNFDPKKVPREEIEQINVIHKIPTNYNLKVIPLISSTEKWELAFQNTQTPEFNTDFGSIATVQGQ